MATTWKSDAPPGPEVFRTDHRRRYTNIVGPEVRGLTGRSVGNLRHPRRPGMSIPAEGMTGP